MTESYRTAPAIYLDQSALIDLYQSHHNQPTGTAKNFEVVKENRFVAVLSPWHLVETAKAQHVKKAGQLADFMDELQPLWLRDRRDLERIEVQTDFFSFANVPYTPPACLTSSTEIWSAMRGRQLSPDTTPSSREFVEAWIANPQLMAPLIRSHLANADALNNLREAIVSGKLTAAMRAEGDRKLIAGFLPQKTPAGIIIDEGTKKAYLDTVSPKHFPTLAIESEVSEYSWAGQGRTDWNSMIDKFHLISALSHVDIIVSDDRYFSLLLPAAAKTKFGKASLFKFNEFHKAFVL